MRPEAPPGLREGTGTSRGGGGIAFTSSDGSDTRLNDGTA